jgi:hypothetical protein
MDFIQVEVWVEGDTPLLQNRASEEALTGKTRMNTPGEEEDPRDIAERTVYRLQDRAIAIPGSAFMRLLREAGGSHKSKGSRKSLKWLVPAAVLVLDDLCPLYLHDRRTPIKDFEVDTRPVTIPATKGRIIRHRSRFNEWACRVNLRINTSILDEKTVRLLMTEGLAQIGLGDYRPEKGGPFGVSALVSWKIISDKLPKTAAQTRNGGTRPVAPVA